MKEDEIPDDINEKRQNRSSNDLRYWLMALVIVVVLLVSALCLCYHRQIKRYCLTKIFNVYGVLFLRSGKNTYMVSSENIAMKNKTDSQTTYSFNLQ